MPDELVIVPSNGDGYVELARTKTGRLFKKHIFTMGDLRHPVTGNVIKVDDTFVSTLTKNFRDGVCDIVQVPLANANNEHTEAPERNIGEVIDVQVKDKKVYAVMDIRDDTHADKMGKTYLGASAMLHLDYTDTATGNKVGPTLLHACVTNRPYVTGLESYEEIVAATSDTSGGAVLLTAETDVVVADDQKVIEEPDMPDAPKNVELTTPAKPTLEELLTALKTDHHIDVTALQTKAVEGDQAALLSKTLVDALTVAGVVKLSAANDKDQVSTADVIGAVSELAQNNVVLTNRVGDLERADAEHAVQALIEQGRVLPVQKNPLVELRLTNPSMFDALVPVEPIVKLNHETGVTPPEDGAHAKNIDAEIARLSAIHDSVSARK